MDVIIVKLLYASVCFISVVYSQDTSEYCSNSECMQMVLREMNDNILALRTNDKAKCAGIYMFSSI